MYPLNMKLESGVGFALANDEAEHKVLSDAGYGPKLAKAPTVKSVRAALDAAGIAYEKGMSLDELTALLPA